MLTFHATAWRVRRMVTDIGGVTRIEYAVITFLVSVTLGFVMPYFTDALEGFYNQAFSVLEGIGPDR